MWGSGVLGAPAERKGPGRGTGGGRRHGAVGDRGLSKCRGSRAAWAPAPARLPGVPWAGPWWSAERGGSGAHARGRRSAGPPGR